MLSEFVMGVIGVVVAPPMLIYQAINPDTSNVQLDKTKTIQGIDNNKNMIRDDIENHINTTFIDHEINSYLKHYYKRYSTAYSSATQGNESADLTMIIQCLGEIPSTQGNKKDLAMKMIGNSHYIYFNTKQRKEFFNQQGAWKHPLYAHKSLFSALSCDEFKAFD